MYLFLYLSGGGDGLGGGGGGLGGGGGGGGTSSGCKVSGVYLCLALTEGSYRGSCSPVISCPSP